MILGGGGGGGGVFFGGTVPLVREFSSPPSSKWGGGAGVWGGGGWVGGGGCLVGFFMGKLSPSFRKSPHHLPSAELGSPAGPFTLLTRLPWLTKKPTEPAMSAEPKGSCIR